MEANTDDRLWRLAKKRAAFKRHLVTYFIMNLFFWAIWWFTQGQRTGFTNIASMWPVWPMLGWGLGVAFQYFGAYGPGNQQDAVQAEFEKLKRKQQ